MQRPLLWVAVSFALGILAANTASVPASYLLLPALALALIALISARLRPWLLYPLCFIAGAVSFTTRTAILAPDDLRTALGNEPHQASIRGKLIDTPYERVFERDGAQRWRTLARIAVDSIHLDEQWSTACGEIIVTTPDILPDHFYHGQHVQIEGVIRRPRTAPAPGCFDYRRYLKTLGIHYELWVASTNDWQLLSPSRKLPLSARFVPWAQRLLARGLAQDWYVELLWAMTLGWKTALSGEVSEPFMRSGTMHVFAISGLHIALIAAILVASLKLFRFRLRTCACIVIPLIWMYTAVTGWQASAIRSTIMSSVIIIGYSMLRRPTNLLNSVLAAGFFILVWDPLQLFQAGFQLSLFVVLSIVLLMDSLDRFLQRICAPDPFLPPQFVPKHWHWQNAAAKYFVPSLAVSLAAWLGSLPLTAYYFHLLTPLTVFTNMIVVPLSSGALACNLATLAIGALCAPAAELFNHCAWFFMMLMVKVSEWAAAIQPLVFHVSMPGFVFFTIYYALLIALFSGWLFRAHVRKWAAGAMAAAVLPFAAGDWWRNEPVMTVLPLAGGSAVYVKHGDEWLVDSGDLQSARYITKPFLQSRGVNRLHHLLLTHGDVRHVEAAPLIHDLFSVRNIYMSPLRFRSRPYRLVQDYFRTNNVAVKTLVAGDHIGIWKVLHPDADSRFTQADDNAMVLFGIIHTHRVLLLSDLGIAGQNALFERHPGLKADIIVTGLPRESDPIADGFIEAVQPSLIIVADSEFPAPERAHDPLRARLAKHRIPIIYTSDSGTVTLKFKRHTFAIQTTNASESN